MLVREAKTNQIPLLHVDQKANVSWCTPNSTWTQVELQESQAQCWTPTRRERNLPNRDLLGFTNRNGGSVWRCVQNGAWSEDSFSHQPLRSVQTWLPTISIEIHCSLQLFLYSPLRLTSLLPRLLHKNTKHLAMTVFQTVHQVAEMLDEPSSQCRHIDLHMERRSLEPLLTALQLLKARLASISFIDRIRRSILCSSGLHFQTSNFSITSE